MYMKRTLTAALALCLAYILTACSSQPVTAENLINSSVEKAEKAKSISYTMDYDVDVVTNLMGSTSNGAISQSFIMETDGTNSHYEGNQNVTNSGDMSTLTGGTDINVYIIKTDSNYEQYTLLNGQWIKQPITDNPYTTLSDITPLLSPVGECTMEEGEDQYTISADIDADKTLAFFSVLSAQSGGTSLTSVEGISTVPATYVFDKETKELQSITIDGSELSQQVFNQLIEQAMAMSEGFGDEGYDMGADFDFSDMISFDITSMEISLHDFNLGDVPTVALPQEAASAAD